MSVSTSRLGARPRAAWAIALWLVVGVGAPAAATPVTVFFDGPSGYGVGASRSGFPDDKIIEPASVLSASDVLTVISQDLQLGSVDPFPPEESDNHATSIWTVQNESSDDLLENNYLLFLTSVPDTFGGETVEYEDDNVGLSIDPDLGWRLVRTSGGYYYPAISLGSLGAGETAAPFAVNYVVDEPIQQVITTWVLPQLAVGRAIVPIPEPSAGALMGVGLALLAVGRWRRS
jgi:hypothetical protein